MTHFKGKQFKEDIIMVAAGYYLRYNLSYHDISEILRERGVYVCHTTIYRWVQKYSKVLYFLWKKRDGQAAYTFFKRLGKQFCESRVLVTDKAPSLSCAFKLLRSQGYFTSTIHRTSKYLNNIIEQDHRSIKKRHKLYKSVRTASTTIKGIETILALFKKTRKDGNLFGFSVTFEMNKSLDISA